MTDSYSQNSCILQNFKRRNTHAMQSQLNFLKMCMYFKNSEQNFMSMQWNSCWTVPFKVNKSPLLCKTYYTFKQNVVLLYTNETCRGPHLSTIIYNQISTVLTDRFSDNIWMRKTPVILFYNEMFWGCQDIFELAASTGYVT